MADMRSAAVLYSAKYSNHRDRSQPPTPPAGSATNKADWFFRGEHAYTEPHTWSEL
ncbi:hypothetical protein ACWDZW_07295 [Streptomyces coeruleorubidus]|uniref:hypothetical protein n=1 Tax=Streptomyces coeruleorubidus TaxID=116188 RepID=UPI0033E4961B